MILVADIFLQTRFDSTTNESPGILTSAEVMLALSAGGRIRFLFFFELQSSPNRLQFIGSV
jgi:2-keto-3-deoxy-6-phosphogluconate aldolase